MEINDKPTYQELEDQIAELKKQNDNLRLHSSAHNEEKKRETELLSAKEKVEESESNLNSLINNRDESIWSIDNNYNYIIFNNFFKEAYLATFNVELQKGLNSLNILTPGLLEFWKSKYDKALSGERVVFEISNQVGKELRYYEVSLNPIILNGKATGVSGISSDITEKKETHRILLQSRANILAILENTTDSIWAINSSYEILFANDVFVSAFHTTFGVRLGPGVNLLLSLPKPMRQLWKSHYDRVLSNEMFSFIDKIEVENGTIHIEVHLNPIVVDDKVIGASFFGKDITRRIKSEEALKESETQLRELNVTKDKLFSIIAHDLRSPFNSILGFSELLIENAKNSDIVESEMHSRIINSSAKNTLILLDNLLDWAKSQTGQISFKPEKINLLSIIQEIIESSNLMAKIKNISLNLIQSEEIEAYADANMVKTVLRNLISNAIKFTNPGGNINVNGISEQNQVEISISDNGIGMNDETRKKLFDISSNITFLGTTKEKGSGLGLVLCKEFVERLGGHIWVESEEGKGSDFRFSLPLNKT